MVRRELSHAQGLLRALPFLVAWKLWREYQSRGKQEQTSLRRFQPLVFAPWCDNVTCEPRAPAILTPEATYCEAGSSREEMVEMLEDVAQMGTRFDMKRILKRSESTRVYECGDKTLLKPVAVKIVDNSGSAPSVTSLQKEVDLILSFINAGVGDCFVPIHYFDDNGSSTVLAMDLCSGDLCDKMTDVFSSPDEAFSTSVIRSLMLRMIECLDCLHSRDLAHLDIKPDNFVFSAKTLTKLTPNDIRSLKLIDLSGVTANDEAGRMSEVMTTLYYAAPELLKSQETDLLACDVWAMGVIFYILLSQGSYPLTERDIFHGEIFTDGGVELRKRIEEVGAPAEAKDLLVSMLALDEKERPTLRDIKNHSFFRCRDDVKLQKRRRMRGTFGRAAKVDRRVLMPYKVPRTNIIVKESPVEASAPSEEKVAPQNEMRAPKVDTSATPSSTPNPAELRESRRSGISRESLDSEQLNILRRRASDVEREKRKSYSMRYFRGKGSPRKRRKKPPIPTCRVPRRRSTSLGSASLSRMAFPAPSTNGRRNSRQRRATVNPAELAAMRDKSFFLHRMPMKPTVSSDTSDGSESEGTDSSDSSSNTDSCSSLSDVSDDSPFNFDNPLLVSPFERMKKRECATEFEEMGRAEVGGDSSTDTRTDDRSDSAEDVLPNALSSSLSLTFAPYCTGGASPVCRSILTENPMFWLIK